MFRTVTFFLIVLMCCWQQDRQYRKLTVLGMHTGDIQRWHCFRNEI